MEDWSRRSYRLHSGGSGGGLETSVSTPGAACHQPDHHRLGCTAHLRQHTRSTPYILSYAGIRTDPIIGKDIEMNGDTCICNGNFYLTGDINRPEAGTEGVRGLSDVCASGGSGWSRAGRLIRLCRRYAGEVLQRVIESNA